MDCRPLSTSCWETSRTITSQPDWAATWAMPEPIRPQPATPTFSRGILFLRGDYLSYGWYYGLDGNAEKVESGYTEPNSSRFRRRYTGGRSKPAPLRENGNGIGKSNGG